MKHLLALFVLAFFVSAIFAQEAITLSVSPQAKPDSERFAWNITAMVRPQTDISGGELDIQLSDGFKVRTILPEQADLKANQNSFFYLTVESDKPLPSATIAVSLKNKPERHRRPRAEHDA